MGKITFILGGARSGKSSFATKLAKDNYGKIAFIATCQGLDSEIKKRIRRHKKSRPKHWQTFEEPKQLFGLLKKNANKFDCLIIDCLTLLISNLLLDGVKEKDIEQQIRRICALFKQSKSHIIIVSNEVGMSIVPENKLARDFRDIAGRINQIVAGHADEVFLMFCGISIKLK
ncbi:MAG: bifunctional adenosylcobinamide kinase/adenosylcobinamide-phosphate guanylyltransferase [Candidatus Omnitrophota bacterium]